MTKPSLAVRGVALNYSVVFNPQTSCRSGRRAAALLCLAAFLIGNTELLPFLTALAAEIDAGHEVQIENGEGGACVRLHHTSGAGADAREQGTHRHGLVCELMCSLWAQSGQEPDHLLAFAAGAVCEESKEFKLASIKAQEYRLPSAPLVVPWDMTSIPSFSICPARALTPERANAPPPHSALRLSRSVSLLI
jgi:hypothetical protein